MYTIYVYIKTSWRVRDASSCAEWQCFSARHLSDKHPPPLLSPARAHSVLQRSSISKNTKWWRDIFIYFSLIQHVAEQILPQEYKKKRGNHHGVLYIGMPSDIPWRLRFRVYISTCPSHMALTTPHTAKIIKQKIGYMMTWHLNHNHVTSQS